MADKNKPEINDENVETELDDKSINELLKEYADDVKDKDLDDFLQDAPDEDDDEGLYENDDELMEGVAPKKRSGIVGLLAVLLLCGAAGAGAWMYLNRDDGMTTVMGGFKGEPALSDDFIASPTRTPIVPEANPEMPAFMADNSGQNAPTGPAPELDFSAASNDLSEPVTPTTGLRNMLADDLPPPMPISNEGADDSLVPLEDINAQAQIQSETKMSVTTDTTTQSPAGQLSAGQSPAVQAPETARAPAAPSKTNTQDAVRDWLSTSNDDMPEVEEKLPPVTEVPVREMNARPVKNAEKPKETAKSASSSSASSGVSAPVRAPALSAADGALPPPYLAIQARKAAGLPATSTTATVDIVDNLEVDTQVYVRGATAHTEPVSTRATGIYRELVTHGGGEIEIDTTIRQSETVSVDVDTQGYTPYAPSYGASHSYATPAPQEAPAADLAISGGRSYPDGRVVKTGPNTQTSVQLPSATSTPVAPQAAQAAPAPSYAVPSAPVSAPVSVASEAGRLVREAQNAEAAGKLDEAITLYQRALESDAIYGDGRSIDRGMVYDRIGAIRARR